MKRIAILTSGGDAPGMNAAIRAIVRKGIHEGFEVYGVKYGFAGLVAGDIYKLTSQDVSDKISRGGTFLYSARHPEFSKKQEVEKAIDNLKKIKIEGLVVIGGDGSFRGALALLDEGFPTIGIPATIDNDIPSTDYCIGFDTALNTVLDAVDKVRDTFTSHVRTAVIEVMGRNSGDIALWTGLAGGAEEIIIPEVEFDFENIANNITKRNRNHKKHNIIMVAEGTMKGSKFAHILSKYGDFEVRSIELGHVQRGGSPTAKDRVIASKFGSQAIEAFKKGKTGVCLGLINNEIVQNDLRDTLENQKHEAELALQDLNKEIS